MGTSRPETWRTTDGHERQGLGGSGHVDPSPFHIIFRSPAASASLSVPSNHAPRLLETFEAFLERIVTSAKQRGKRGPAAVYVRVP